MSINCEENGRGHQQKTNRDLRPRHDQHEKGWGSSTGYPQSKIQLVTTRACEHKRLNPSFPRGVTSDRYEALSYNAIGDARSWMSCGKRKLGTNCAISFKYFHYYHQNLLSEYSDIHNSLFHRQVHCRLSSSHNVQKKSNFRISQTTVGLRHEMQ